MCQTMILAPPDRREEMHGDVGNFDVSLHHSDGWLAMVRSPRRDP